MPTTTNPLPDAPSPPAPLSPAARALLFRVATRLGTPDRWCQGAYATAADGSPRLWFARDATRWCLQGALLAEHHGDRAALHEATEALQRAARAHFGMLPVFVNDHLGYAAIQALLRALLGDEDETRCTTAT